MNIPDLNINTASDYLPTEINYNKSTNYLYNPNSSSIFLTKNSQIMYGTGVDDYVFNEIKKAKYQGCFDPGSLGNKNIFMDSHRITKTDSNLKIHKKNAFERNKQYSNYTSSRIHKHDEGKNLLIAKSEIQYPLKFDKRLYVLNKNIKTNENNNLNYCLYKSTPLTLERNYPKSKNIRQKFTSNYNYYTPIYNQRYDDEYQNRALNYLMNNYCENSKKINRGLKTNYSKYSTDKIKYSTILPSQNKYCSPNRFLNLGFIYESNNSYNYNNRSTKSNHKKLYTYNTSNLKSSEKIYSYKDNNNNDIIILNDIESNNEDFNNQNDINNEESNNEEEIEIEKENINNVDFKHNKNSISDIQLINIYKNKLTNIFFSSVNKFTKKMNKRNFNYFILQLKEYIKNKSHHFEHKTIKNIAEIKNQLKSNSYYYGHNKQFKNLLKETKSKKIIKKNILYLNNIDPDFKDIKEKNKIIRKKNLINYNTTIRNKINEKITSDNINKNEEKKINATSSKKYMKKKVSQGVFNKINKSNNSAKKVYIKKNNNNNIEEKKIINSYYKKGEIKRTMRNYNNVIMSYNVSKVQKKTEDIKPRLFIKANIQNSFNLRNSKDKIIKTNKNIIKNKNQDDNINTNNGNNDLLEKRNLYEIIMSEDEDKNKLHIYDNLEGTANNNKLNMTLKYLEIDNNNMSSRRMNDMNEKNYIIDNQISYTIIGNGVNIKNDDENKDEDETFSSKNLQSAITIITKIMENKEKDEKNNYVNSLLLKIVQNKINKENNQNLELIKKYFNIFKFSDEDFEQIHQRNGLENSLDIVNMKSSNINNDKEESENNILNSYNDIFNKKEKSIIYENEEENKSTVKGTGKFRVVIKKVKIHKSITKNILNSQYRRIFKLNNSSKNIMPNLSGISNIHSKKYKKTNSFNKYNKSKKDNKMNNIHEIVDNDNGYEKKAIEIEKISTIENNIEQKKNNTIENKKPIIKRKISEKELNLANSENLSINNELSNESNNMVTNSEKFLHKKLKVLRKKNLKEDKKKSLVIHKKKNSIKNFAEYRKGVNKLNKSKNKKDESIKEGDLTLYEKYQDYENLIFYLRTQLIYCFITNRKNDEFID